MKRSGKKLMLASLMSVALISSNMSFVYATETPAEVSESTASEETPVESESSEQAESVEQAESAEETESVEQTEAEDVDSTEADKENAEETESAENTETEEQTQDAEPAETEEQTEDAESAETEEQTETEEEADEELLFVDKDGNEIKPSSLVSTDYTAVAEDYDGELNVIKQYVESDEYEENIIMDSYVDEDGNLVIVISQGPAKEEAASSSLFKLNSSTVGDAPAVDGSFTGWDDIPASYEFNWNKSDAWVDGVHYTETNSTDVRHEMKLFSDGENVYLKVVFAREFCNGQVANGNDYQFWIDNEQMAAYQVEWPNGSSLSYNTAEPGTYEVEVRHRDSSWSYVLTDGAVAYYHINEGNLNNELELKIPLSEFVKQNPNIDLDNYNMIGFFTPNLMQDKIYTAGASTGAAPFAAVVFLAVPASYIWLKKKKEGELAPA